MHAVKYMVKINGFHTMIFSLNIRRVFKYKKIGFQRKDRQYFQYSGAYRCCSDYSQLKECSKYFECI